MNDVAKGVGLALVTSASLMVIPTGLVLPLVAIFMGVAGGVYVGFALKDPEAKEAPIQWAGAIVFAVAAALGLWASPWSLVARRRVGSPRRLGRPPSRSNTEDPDVLRLPRPLCRLRPGPRCFPGLLDRSRSMTPSANRTRQTAARQALRLARAAPHGAHHLAQGADGVVGES